jgi:transposase
MFGSEKRVLAKHYLDQGLSHLAVAKLLGINRRTLHRWIGQGAISETVVEPPRYTPRPPVATKLDPFKSIIQERLDLYPALSSVRLLGEVRAAGYAGGYTQLREFAQTVRPKPPQEPPVRFETAPGKQAQVDFGKFRLPWGMRNCLLVVLGYSRLLWMWFYQRQDMRTLIHGLESAFAFFGGVTEELLFDQMKTVITRDDRLKGGDLVKNAEFQRFAAHWNCAAKACRPYRAQTKGKVERPIRYVRGNFFYGRDFLNDADLNHQGMVWLDQVANVRIHYTTKERPYERFLRDEQAVLGPLAARPYTSLVLPAQTELELVSARPQLRPPALVVERRPLSAYTDLIGGVP